MTYSSIINDIFGTYLFYWFLKVLSSNKKKRYLVSINSGDFELLCSIPVTLNIRDSLHVDIYLPYIDTNFYDWRTKTNKTIKTCSFVCMGMITWELSFPLVPLLVVIFVADDSPVARVRSGDSSDYTMAGTSVTVKLRAGQDVWVQHISESDSNAILGQSFSTFSGYLVQIHA